MFPSAALSKHAAPANTLSPVECFENNATTSVCLFVCGTFGCLSLRVHVEVSPEPYLNGFVPGMPAPTPSGSGRQFFTGEG